MKIAIIVGTNAEMIKMFPLVKEIASRGIEYKLIHTGQHELNEEIYKAFEIKKPDIVLSKIKKFNTNVIRAIVWGIQMIPKIRFELEKFKPDYVLFHGDTITTVISAIASMKFNGCHIEAGLRSGDVMEPFPEELSRIIADRFSKILFVPSEAVVNNVKWHPKVYVVGNTIVDSVDFVLNKFNTNFYKVGSQYAVINIHRQENIKSKKRMRKILDIIKNVKIPLVWTIHENTKQQLIKFGMWNEIQDRNISFFPLWNYQTFLNLLKYSQYILCDGGSIQEEASILKKPCLLLRMKTERKDGLVDGSIFLTELRQDISNLFIEHFEEPDFIYKDYKNPYGELGVSKRIVDKLVDLNKEGEKK